MKKGDTTADGLPPLTDQKKADLRRLAGLSDRNIDTSDLPEPSNAQLAEMKRGTLYKPIKQQITAQVDADVLAWLKSDGKGYQSRMNAILRRAILSAK